MYKADKYCFTIFRYADYIHIADLADFYIITRLFLHQNNVIYSRMIALMAVIIVLQDSAANLTACRLGIMNVLKSSQY